MARAAGTANGLTEKQERFVLAYFKGLNASEAYREVYRPKKMSAPAIEVEASRLLKRPRIALRLAELRAKLEARALLSVEKVMAQLARIVNCDPADFFDKKGNLLPIHELTPDARAALASIESFEEYEGRGEDRQATGMVRKVKFWPKVEAIDKAMKHLGLFKKDNEQRADPMALLLKWISDRNAASGTHGLPIKN